jgi:SAM-dependent methyltransferase
MRDLPELRFGITDRFSVFVCTTCGTSTTYPQPAEEYLNALYERYYVPAEYVSPDKKLITELSQELQKFNSALLKQWRRDRSTEIPMLFYDPRTNPYVKDCHDVLDVGAYTGENMLWLQAGGWNVTGLEPNVIAAAIAARLPANVHPVSLEHNNLPSHSFDLVYLSYVIEHLVDPNRALTEVKRLLRPGGKLLLTTHNIRSLWRTVFGKYWINWHTPFHLWHFSAKTLAQLLENHGFKMIYLDTRTPKYWLLFSIRAMRDDLRYKCPNKNLFTPMSETVNARLNMLLRIEETTFQGDCTIGIFKQAD